jgi:hypothetical protein
LFWKEKKRPEEWTKKIIDFIKNYHTKHSKWPRTKEIREKMFCSCIHRYLTPLVNAGKLKKYREGIAVRYEINDKLHQQIPQSISQFFWVLKREK